MDRPITGIGEARAGTNEEILANYDFHPIRRSEIEPSPPAGFDDVSSWTPRESTSKISHSDDQPNGGNESARIGARRSRALPETFDISAIDGTVKKYADILMHSIEGVSSRVSQLESRTRSIEQALDELRSAIGSVNGVTDGKLRQLDQDLREVKTGLQFIQDKQAKEDNHPQLDSSPSSSSPAQPEYTPQLPAQQPPEPQYAPQPPAQQPAQPEYTPQLPAQQPPQPQYTPQPPARQPPQPQYAPQPPAQQPAQPEYPPQLPPQQPPQPQYAQPPAQFPAQPPYTPEQPAQSLYTPQLPAQLQYTPQLPPQLHYTPHLPAQPPNAPPVQHPEFHPPPPSNFLPPQAPPSPFTQSVQPPSPSGPPMHQAQYSDFQQYSLPPQRNQMPAQPFPSPPRQPETPLNPPPQSFTGPHHQIYEPATLQPHYGPAISDPHPLGPVKPALPTAKLLPQDLPVAAEPGGNFQSGKRVPVNDVVERVAAMGFPKDLVRETVKKMTENGQSVDLNVVLDKLMNGPGNQPRKGWFGQG